MREWEWYCSFSYNSRYAEVSPSKKFDMMNSKMSRFEPSQRYFAWYKAMYNIQTHETILRSRLTSVSSFISPLVPKRFSPRSHEKIYWFHLCKLSIVCFLLAGHRFMARIKMVHFHRDFLADVWKEWWKRVCSSQAKYTLKRNERFVLLASNIIHASKNRFERVNRHWKKRYQWYKHINCLEIIFVALAGISCRWEIICFAVGLKKLFSSFNTHRDFA